ncbi:MAG: two-component system, OmpR family, phosphate regulon sensor histidine kinase PhoR [Chloroflexota bacterium]|nr:two-component system, OmpR family, phosphate regulon sensor histidine kinase PhoR [Chloroflexota bacterium]
MFWRLIWRVGAGYLLLLAFVLVSLSLTTPIGSAGADWVVPAAGLGLAAAALLTLGTTALVAQVTTRRVEALTVTARQIAAGELSRMAQVTGDDEIGVLAQALNAMADQLRRRIRAAENERERLAAVLTHMADGVIIADQEGTVRQVNPAAARLLDILPERAVGRSLMAVVRSHEAVAAVRAALAAAGSDALPRLLEVGPPAQPRIVQIVVSQIPGGAGEPSDAPQVLVALQDVTELQRVAAVRRDFVANVSHELRTPVAALKALVETLANGALDDREAAFDFLGRMEVETEQLAGLVEDLLELSRVEAGQIELHPEPVDLAAVAAGAAERLRPLAERHGIVLEVEPRTGGTEALADPVWTGQVVTNLVHNAVKFTPPGGRVCIGTAPHPEGVAVTVRDTGPGIPPDALPRLFERFYKADRARTGGGTGLGLAIAKHLVQAQGGRIWADSGSMVGGATFGFVLPAA